MKAPTADVSKEPLTSTDLVASLAIVKFKPEKVAPEVPKSTTLPTCTPSTNNLKSLMLEEAVEEAVEEASLLALKVIEVTFTSSLVAFRVNLPKEISVLP